MTTSAQNMFKYAIYLVISGLFLAICWPFLPSIIFAAFFAVVFHPVFVILKDRYRLNRNLAALSVLLFTLFFIFAPIIAFLGLVAREVLVFADAVDRESAFAFLDQISNFNFFGFDFNIDSLRENVQQLLQNSAGTIYEIATAAGATISSYIFLFFVFIFLYFFFLKDGELIIAKINKSMPFRENQNKKLFSELSRVAKTVFVGNLGVAAISGLVSYVGFLIFGLQGALIWALLVAILSLIPTIGSLIVYLIGIAIVAYGSGLVMAILLLAYYVLFEIVLIQNFIKPKIVEDKIGVHPILVFFGLVGGVILFKSAGVLYGPLIVVAFVTIFDL